ncbi:MAG: hypothetical protein KF760_34620 [Candidatus Eremiobacteraeota bacterium]|nr:hypothetical protein [Candidatus Eremiobacteraeota bacterium]MCW5868400.1 hypothetical protein [Candidatus Eremiobacteraeota bacterium]
MRELLLGTRTSSRNWLLFLALGVLLAKVFSWAILMLPPMWFSSRALPLILRTVKLSKNEEMLASGQASRLEARSYRLYLSLLGQALIMAGLLLAVHQCLHPGTFRWVYFKPFWLHLALSPLCHPYPYRRRWTHLLWLASSSIFCWQSSARFLLPWFGFLTLLVLYERIKSPLKDALVKPFDLCPAESSENPYEFRICRLLRRAPYSKLIGSFWAMSLFALYALVACQESELLRFLAPSMGCGFLVLFGTLLYKERSTRCHELAPTSSEELRRGLSRPIGQLSRTYCGTLAAAVLPLWLLFPQQGTTLFALSCQLALISPLTFQLLAPILFRVGHSRTPVAGFWLAMLATYLLGWMPGLAADALLRLCQG